MRTYARVQDGRVAELMATDAEMRTMFHPALIWIDVSDLPGIAVGWRYDGTNWTAPPALVEEQRPMSLSDLQAQLSILTAQVSKLSEQK